MGEVWDLDLPLNEQAVLLAMADHADHDGSKVFPSNGLVAWKLGVSEDTVSRLKKKLEERGILVLVKSLPGRVKEYRIDLSQGQKKQPYVPRRTQNQEPTDDDVPHNPPASCGPPQIAAPRKPDATPPQMAHNPPAKLCGPNHHITIKEPSSSAHAEFIRLWHDEYLKVFRRKYVFGGGKDGAALKRLLSAADTPASRLVELAKACWFLNSHPFYHCQRAVTIAYFASHYNELMAELTRSGRMPSPPMPPGQSCIQDF